MALATSLGSDVLRHDHEAQEDPGAIVLINLDGDWDFTDLCRKHLLDRLPDVERVRIWDLAPSGDAPGPEAFDAHWRNWPSRVSRPQRKTASGPTEAGDAIGWDPTALHICKEEIGITFRARYSPVPIVLIINGKDFLRDDDGIGSLRALRSFREGLSEHGKPPVVLTCAVTGDFAPEPQSLNGAFAWPSCVDGIFALEGPAGVRRAEMTDRRDLMMRLRALGDWLMADGAQFLKRIGEDRRSNATVPAPVYGIRFSGDLDCDTDVKAAAFVRHAIVTHWASLGNSPSDEDRDTAEQAVKAIRDRLLKLPEEFGTATGAAEVAAEQQPIRPDLPRPTNDISDGDPDAAAGRIRGYGNEVISALQQEIQRRLRRNVGGPDARETEILAKMEKIREDIADVSFRAFGNGQAAIESLEAVRDDVSRSLAEMIEQVRHAAATEGSDGRSGEGRSGEPHAFEDDVVNRNGSAYQSFMRALNQCADSARADAGTRLQGSAWLARFGLFTMVLMIAVSVLGRFAGGLTDQDLLTGVVIPGIVLVGFAAVPFSMVFSSRRRAVARRHEKALAKLDEAAAALEAEALARPNRGLDDLARTQAVAGLEELSIRITRALRQFRAAREFRAHIQDSIAATSADIDTGGTEMIPNAADSRDWILNALQTFRDVVRDRHPLLDVRLEAEGIRHTIRASFLTTDPHGEVVLTPQGRSTEPLVIRAADPASGSDGDAGGA